MPLESFREGALRFVLPASFLVLPFVAFACAGGKEGAPPAAAPFASASAADGMGASLVPGADPICGDKWKWDGTRCVQLAETEDSAKATEGKSASLPPDDPARSVASGVGSSKLLIKDLKLGDGPEAKLGSMVKIHYVGTLTDGTEFDSSRKRGTPFEFRLGSGQVIRGFEKAVTGMKVGGMRKVTIPPELGYGRKGAPPLIPPNATLEFEIELVDST